MLFTRTPYRISLFGGGSDFPQWYKYSVGKVLSFTIDKFCYLSCRELPPFFPNRHRLVYSKVESPKETYQIEHPAIREGIKRYASNYNLEIQHHGDLPARSGVGSSSAFAVGLINALRALQGVRMTKENLAREAIFFEQDILGEAVGSQDQIACSFGGINKIEFEPGKQWKVTPLPLNLEKLTEIESRCFLVFSGQTRLSSEISEGLLSNLHTKTDLIRKTVSLADQAVELITSSNSLDYIGELLLDGWSTKKRMNSMVETSSLNEFIDLGIACGALGAKVLGAGGGGFVLFWLKLGDRERFAKAFNLGVEVPFKIDYSGACMLTSTSWEQNV